jgi:hypothetical protein
MAGTTGLEPEVLYASLLLAIPPLFSIHFIFKMTSRYTHFCKC